ncbi:bacterial transcriptional activator domain-containing protein [Amycolatopsis sp. WAC 01375]|uniref:AfsR/SARP family transcriptional regulator n=1 Tax=Amycolatopsis sp. WAC 01375 TaxID=2203194 RepID=UPI00131528E3|nr:bacterial transcriptional activator domain-containing protein [Amycolatopsis sp. WAC 01375]
MALTTLVDLVWEPSEQTDNSLRSVGDYIRKVRAAIKKGGGAVDSLRYERGARSCTLNIDPSCVDYHQFHAVAAAARQERDPETFRQALALWHGEALADIRNQWADNRRNDLETERRELHLDLLDLQLAAGKHAEVIQATTEMIDHDIPTDRVLVLGAQGLAGCGRHTAIEAWKTRVIRRMHETVGADPAHEALNHISQLIANPHWSPSSRPTAAVSELFSMRTDVATFTSDNSTLRDPLPPETPTSDTNDASSTTTEAQLNSPAITMTVTASDSSRVYQAGRDQHITEA